MSYNVTVWSNTGFNPDNIPDSPALLGAGTSVQAIDIMQNRGLSSIKISMSWNDAKNIDVCRVGDWYYYVAELKEALASDVTKLNFIADDAILSVGGVANVEFIDGVTERCHLTDSSLGNKSDPLLLPNEPLDLEVSTWNPTNGADSIVVAETTCDAPATFRRRGVFIYEQAGEKSHIPEVNSIRDQDECVYKMPSYLGGQENKRGSVADTYSILGDGVVAYNETSEQTRTISLYSHIKEAVVNTLFGMGIPDAIASLVEYPETLVSLTTKTVRDDQGKGDGKEIDGSTVESFERIVKIQGNSLLFSNAPTYKYLANTIKNDLLHVSDYTNYGIVTASGAQAEYTVSEIRNNSMTLDEEVRPQVRVVADPNPDGRPYYRFKRFHGNEGAQQFMINSLPGLSWKENPLVYTGKVGGDIDKFLTQMNGDMAERHYFIDRMSGATDAIKRATGHILGSANSNSSGLMYDLKGGRNLSYAQYASRNSAMSASAYGVGQALGDVVNYTGESLMRNNELHETTMQIKANYFASQIATPTVRAPYASEPLRKVLGNGCLVYRYKYTANDAARIDKLITMYGCMYTGQLTKSMMTSRRYFNFIKANSVSCTGHSMSVDARIAQQLSDGVRIWHVKPDKSYYETENI